MDLSWIQEIMPTDFFQSALFGILAMVLVGSSWCLTGFIMGDAPKKGVDPCLVQFFGFLLTIAASLLVLLGTDSFPHCPLPVLLLTCGALALGGALNFFMLLIMSYAMQRGPNGIIWAIIQSALIFPFLGGVLFFHVAITGERLLGLAALLAALGFFACGKDNSRQGTGWKLPAFLCLMICAVQQNLTTSPSYFEEAREVNSIVRTLASAIGGLLAALLYLLFRSSPARTLIANLHKPALWKYVAGLQCFNLIFAYTLFYPGMNAMADHGMGGMCYPLMVGSCIISFTLLSATALKERLRPLQALGLALCLLGLVMLCLPS